MNELNVGDLVAIRGDTRLNMNGVCMYSEDQLIKGKYLKHVGHGGIWTGLVKKISIKEKLALVGGAWRDFDTYEIIIKSEK